MLGVAVDDISSKLTHNKKLVSLKNRSLSHSIIQQIVELTWTFFCLKSSYFQLYCATTVAKPIMKRIGRKLDFL
jgi:hypothetical protein